MREIQLIEGNYRILIIDDNRAIHDDIRKILITDEDKNRDLLSDESFLFEAPASRLEATKFEIESAYQGEEGLARVRQSLADGKPYAMAFVDVRMPPGWDGVETITRLWQADPALQVVICTAYSDYSWADIQTNLGQSDSLLILKKPFDSIEVVQLAHALTQKWTVSYQARAKLEDLDLIVARRTAELQAAHQSLQTEYAERAKAEAAFRIVFEASPIGIALLNEQFRLVKANSALQQLHGIPEESIIGYDPVQLEWFNSQQEMNQLMGALGPGGFDQYEFTLKHGRLGNRTGLLWARRVEIRDVQHALCFVLDITQRKQIEEEVRHARAEAEAAARAKGEFLANMSHEIRTPLNGVLGLSSFLEEQSLPDSIREMGKLIRTSGEMLRRVLDDVLDFSKIESGKLELEDEPFSLRESVDWSAGIYRKAAADKQLALRVSVQSDVPDRLVGDATRLRQVLTNLISNAVKFTEKGIIEVSIRVDERAQRYSSCRLHFAVSDNGIGIPAERMNRLFQSFSQVDASTNRRFGGTGLGLAICKRLTEMMGGQITVTSTPGVGTTFALSIPFGVASCEESPVSPSSELARPRYVLVVEDNVINRVVLHRMLQKLGHQVDLVNDGESAIRHIQERPYDLVFMDINMPGLDGFATTRQIRNMSSAQAKIPIIALTASAMDDDRRACFHAGMNDYLSKPVNIDAVRSIIDRWAANTTLVEAGGLEPFTCEGSRSAEAVYT